MKKITSWVFLLALASAAPVLAQITFTANPSALPAGVNSVTLTWNAPGHAQVDIHVLSATGPQPFGTQVSSGSAPVTASWVVPGLTFYLVDHNTSVVLATLTLTSLGEWDILAADQSACLPFPVLNQGGGYVTCWRVGYFHWYAIGGGWSTGFTLTNPTSSDIAVQITVEGTSGNPYTPPSVVLNGLPLTLGANATAAGTLPAHGVLRFVFPNNGAPGITNGQIYVQVSAKDGVSLNTIQAVEDYTYTNPQNVVYSTVTLPISWVDQAINSYSSMF
ncbi:MAG: hypothetical protein ABSC08_08400, partial [Bryobacteraceae bacterium]